MKQTDKYLWQNATVLKLLLLPKHKIVPDADKFSYPGTAAPTIIGLTQCPNNSMAHTAIHVGTLYPTIIGTCTMPKQFNGTGHTCGYTLIIIMIRFVARTYPPCRVLKARIQKHRVKPLLFHDKCPGFFYVHYTTHGTYTALRPIRRTKQLWLSVLLKDTSAATGQAGIRTHILATPELENNALDRSATTLNH